MTKTVFVRFCTLEEKLSSSNFKKHLSIPSHFSLKFLKNFNSFLHSLNERNKFSCLSAIRLNNLSDRKLHNRAMNERSSTQKEREIENQLLCYCLIKKVEEAIEFVQEKRSKFIV